MQLRKIYNQAHILINTSSYETWGLVVNEAMSAGLPCIITNKTGCAPDLIKNGKSGYTYPVGNLTVLKNYILKIYNNKKVYWFEFMFGTFISCGMILFAMADFEVSPNFNYFGMILK